MKLFSKVKTWLVSALCATLVFSGVGAVTALTNKKAVAAETETVVVSNDIQRIIAALNASLNGNTYIGHASARYVKDYEMANGGVVSGILVERPLLSSADDGTTSTTHLMPINLEFDITKLTGNDSFFGVILSPSEMTDELNATGLDSLEMGLIETDSINGFTFRLYNDDTDYMPAFVAGQKKSASNILKYTNGSSTQLGIYYPTSNNVQLASRGFTDASFQGYNTTPFNVYYDYETNVVYKDTSKIHQTAYYRFANMLNVSPKTYGSVNFDNKYCGVSANDGTSTLTLSNRTAAETNAHTFGGFKNGKARLALRIGSTRHETGTFLITSLMGLDLTNPANEFEDGILVSEDMGVLAGDNIEIPAPRYETVIGNIVEKDFVGTVNVYKGERTYKYSYASYGATTTKIADDLGEAIATGLSVGETFPAEADTKYTLEYIETDGATAYVVVEQSGGYTLNFNGVNTTATFNGTAVQSGDKVLPGGVLKFTANENYSLYNFTSEDNNNEAILLNDKVVKLTANNEYVLSPSDFVENAINIEAVSHSGKYTISAGRLGGGNPSVISVYGGVESKYYAYYDSNMWKPIDENGKTAYRYYNIFTYDGSRIIMYNLPVATGYSIPANKQLIGYALTNTDDGTAIGIAKTGASKPNSIPVFCNLSVDPIVVDSFIKTSDIKTKGTAGLRVKIYIDKSSYDLLTDNYVSYEKENEYGFEANNAQEFKAVIVKGDKYAELSEIVKVGSGSVAKRDLDDSYGWSTFANVNEFKNNMSVSTLTKFSADEEISGITYKVISIVLPGVEKEDIGKSYYVGAFMNIGSCNGGEFLRLGRKAGSSMIEHTYYDASFSFFANGNVVVREEDETPDKKYSYAYGDYVFESDVLQSYEIADVVRAFVVSTYNKAVKFEETDGFVKHATKDVWYDTSVIPEDTDVDQVLDVYALI